MYEILKSINESTALIQYSGHICIRKQILADDIDMYKKLMSVDNPNVVHISEMISDDDGLYAIYDYVNGITLDEHLKKHKTLSDIEIRKIALEICNGLSAIHKLGIIHRDINPNNIMINNEGHAVIIDFGISRIRKEKQSLDTELLGTQGFAAPEQYGFKQTTNRTDIYAVGVLMNYMKTGKFPFDETPDGRLGRIIRKCIQIDDNDRYQDVKELMADINKFGVYPRFLGKLPGFRSDKWWHKLIASVYYITSILCIYVAFTSYNKPIAGVLAAFLLFCTLVVPVPVIFDMGNWTEKLGLTRNRSIKEKRTIKVLICVFAILLACVMIMALAGPADGFSY